MDKGCSVSTLSHEPKRILTLTMLYKIRGLKRSFVIINASSSVFLGGNWTVRKKKKEM